jgi:D-3-phosphoglycerate dehydrogenase
MKVLVADPFEQSGLDGLVAAGCDVVFEPALKDDALATTLRETRAEVLVVRSTKVTAPMMDGGDLALIVRAGAGYNTIDVAAASARGVYVSNCPGKNATAVAELAIGLIIALDRRIPDNVTELRAGRWDKTAFAKAKGLQGRTLGLLGFGTIAQEVARRAQAFGLDLVIWSRRFEASATGSTPDVGALDGYGLDTSGRRSRVSVAGSPGDVASEADILSIHLALADETRGLVDAHVIGRLRPGAILVNTSRAEVLDHEALAAAVRERAIRVGLDVFPGEPTTGTAEFHLPLLDLPGVYGTHHIGASTEQAQEAIAAETVRIVRAFRETGRVPNVVNLARRTPASHLLVVRHRNRPGVLAHVFESLLAAGINVLETENVIFEDAEAAVARINMDGPVSDDELASMREGNPNIISLQLVAL